MPNEIKELLLWVGKGNQLLLFQSRPNDMPSLLVESPLVKKDSVSANLRDIIEGAKDPQDIPLSRIKARNSAGFSGKVATSSRIKDNPELTVLLQDDNGILAAQAKHGKG